MSDADLPEKVGAREICALTSLRGVAAIWVLLFHLDLERPVFSSAWRYWLEIGRGYVAVDLFFALSGFVLALTYRTSFQREPFRTAYPDFLLRRVARVMPLNAAIVAVLAAVTWIAPERAGDSFRFAQDPGAVIANALLVQDWGFAASIDKPAWSVSIEMVIYLAFPLLLALASSWLWVLPAIAAALSLYWLGLTGDGIVSRGLLAGDFIRGFAGFTFGLLVCRIYRSGLLPPVFGLLDVAAVAGFWAAVLLSPTDLLPIVLCPVVVLVLALERGPVARLLGWGPLHYLGQISYSVYLIHYCVLGGLNLLPIRSPLTYAVAALALTLALSAGTYRWIERPARRWIGRRVPGRAR